MTATIRTLLKNECPRYAAATKTETRRDASLTERMKKAITEFFFFEVE